MSKELGATLPEDLLDFLSSTEPGQKFKQVILFSTIDEDRFPVRGTNECRVALLYVDKGCF